MSEPRANPTVNLSTAGAARRAAMRESLTAAVVTRRRRRTTVRVGAGLAAFACLTWFGVWQIGGPEESSQVQYVARKQPPTQALQMAHADFAIVRDDDAVLARATAPEPSGFDFEAVLIPDDESLLRALEEARQPAGILRIDGALQFTSPLETGLELGE